MFGQISAGGVISEKDGITMLKDEQFLLHLQPHSARVNESHSDWLIGFFEQHKATAIFGS